MHKSISLIHIAIFCIKNTMISGKNNILNEVSILIHFGLAIFIKFLFSIFNFLLLSSISSFFSILSHHVSLSNLIKTFPHFIWFFFPFFKFFKLNKLYVFHRATWWLSLFKNYNFRQNWICWNKFNISYCDTWCIAVRLCNLYSWSCHFNSSLYWKIWKWWRLINYLYLRIWSYFWHSLLIPSLLVRW